MGSVTSDQSHDTGLQSEIARWFSALGAKHVEPDFASFRNCEGRLRYAADLTDFEESQPVALIIMTHQGETERHQIEDAASPAYEEDISGPRRTAIAVPVSGFSEFKALQAGLTAAFNTEIENMSLSGLTIFGMYIAPDKGLPAREPEAYTASAVLLDLSSQSAVLFEPEIQRAKIRNWTSAEPSVAQAAKPPSSGFRWRTADSSTRFVNYTQH